MRMPRYYVSNEGMGPYATFYCDKCNREYRSQPDFKQTVTEDVKKGAFGGLLRNVPLVGDSMANNMEQDRYRTAMTQEELAAAWQQVESYFRECPTCHQILCVPDFDEVSGYCDDDSPRRGQIAEAQAEQAGAAMKGFAKAFGLDQAISQGVQQAQQQQQPQPGQAPAQGQVVTPGAGVQCTNCGSTVAAGLKFCGNCGTPVAQERTCPNCGTLTSAAFCGNCGTKVA